MTRSQREELAARLGEVRADKQRAIEAGEHEQAARLRDTERELSERGRGVPSPSADALNAVRRRLGIPRGPGRSEAA